MVVWKFPIPIVDEFSLEMPAHARLLTVQVQHGEPCLWALVDPDAMKVWRLFRLAGTGHPIHWLQELLDYVGTFQLSGGDLVFHLFTRALP